MIGHIEKIQGEFSFFSDGFKWPNQLPRFLKINFSIIPYESFYQFVISTNVCKNTKQ